MGLQHLAARSALRGELLSEHVTSLLVGAGRRRRFARREVLFHEGDLSDSLHVILEGRVAVRVMSAVGAAVTVDVLSRGEILGEIGLVDEQPRRAATTVALEPTLTVAVARTTLKDLRGERPEVTEYLFAVSARRNRDLIQRVAELGSSSADTRVLRRLYALADSYDTGGGVIDIALTQDDIAGLAATTRETVNRVLRREAEAGTFSLTRGLITVLDIDRLQRAAR